MIKKQCIYHTKPNGLKLIIKSIPWLLLSYLTPPSTYRASLSSILPIASDRAATLGQICMGHWARSMEALMIGENVYVSYDFNMIEIEEHCMLFTPHAVKLHLWRCHFHTTTLPKMYILLMKSVASIFTVILQYVTNIFKESFWIYIFL